jgi:N-6 DNA Methylase
LQPRAVAMQLSVNPGTHRMLLALSHHGRHFDYMLSNPPFGVEWKKVYDAVKKEHDEKGHFGRLGPGLPRVSDGSMLFLLHLISKMRRPEDGGSRFGTVLNGSLLFAGGAGCGESEIRRYVHDNVGEETAKDLLLVCKRCHAYITRSHREGYYTATLQRGMGDALTPLSGATKPRLQNIFSGRTCSDEGYERRRARVLQQCGDGQT